MSFLTCKCVKEEKLRKENKREENPTWLLAKDLLNNYSNSKFKLTAILPSNNESQ